MDQHSGSDDTIAAVAEPAARASGVLSRGVAIGRYTVLARLGAGGMGVVYAAYDPELDRKVALKLLHADAPGADQTDARRRLQREAQALAKLAHPNVVAVHDVLEYEGRVVLAMEFVEGTTLNVWRKATPRSWREIVDVFVAAARGLIAAHDRRLIHRDFKPDNVMVTPSGASDAARVRVMDFGLARATLDERDASIDSQVSASALDISRKGAIVGTPAYMAPEQLAGREVGPAADQFAFCVALWEALYGQRPFRGDGLPDLARAISAGERSAPPPGVSVPGWLHRACERGLAGDPSRRFADMHALVATLQSGHRRRRIRIAALAVGVVALVGLAIPIVRARAEARANAACEDDGAAIALVWNDSTRAAVRAGLLDSGITAAATTVDKVTPWLDEHAHAWQVARTDACLNQVHERWDDDMLARATWCLDERKLELDALVTRLAEADSEAANRAVGAAAGLGAIEPCLDEASLRRHALPPAYARDEIPKIYTELARADALLATGAYADGLAVAQSGLAHATALGWPRVISAARRRVGLLLVETGAFAEAEENLQTAYFEALRAGELDEALIAANRLAYFVGISRAPPDDGWLWAQHADALRVGLPDPLGLREAGSKSVVAQIEIERGHFAAAQSDLEVALARVEVALGPEHPEVVRCLYTLGLARFRRGDNAGARADFERALAIVDATKGPTHRDVVASLNNLALVEVKTGAYRDAKAHFERALAVEESASGPNHPLVATIVSNLGVVEFQLDDYATAAALHARALAIREKTLGPEHADVGTCLSNLGLCELVMGRFDEARQLFERALAIKERTLGPDHPEAAEILVNLGDTLLRQGDVAAAEPLFARALPIIERARSPEDPEVAYPLIGLARAAIAGGRAAEAVRLAERALAVREHGDAPKQELAVARVVLARALVLVDAHSTRAAELAQQACASYRDGSTAMRVRLFECETFLRP